MRKTMKLSARGLALLKQWEGFRADAYRDQAGVWTIGWGHTKGVRPGDRVTREQAEAYLRADLIWAEAAVRDAVKPDLLQAQYDALVLFVLNIGETEFKKSTLLRRVNAGRLDDVPEQLARWNKVTIDGKKAVSRGLVNRRAAEAALWAEAGKDHLDIAAEGEAPTPRAAAPDLKPLGRSKEINGSIAGGAGVVAAGGAAVSAIGSLGEIAQVVLIGGLIVAGLAFLALFGNRIIARLNGDR